jgi:predicted transcriptional regulator
MTTLEVTLPEDVTHRLQEAARRLGVSPESLIRMSLEEKLARLDEGFSEAARYVLEKNDELYRRLA